MRCRAPARTRAPKQPTGLFLSLRECPFESQQQNKNGSCTDVHLPFLVRVSRFELEAVSARCAGPAFGRKLKCKRPRVRETPSATKKNRPLTKPVLWSECRDSNSRPLEPHGGITTFILYKLRKICKYQHYSELFWAQILYIFHVFHTRSVCIPYGIRAVSEKSFPQGFIAWASASPSWTTAPRWPNPPAQIQNKRPFHNWFGSAV